MSKIMGEKLLRYSFTGGELLTLFDNPEFMDLRENAETTEEFLRLCVWGSDKLEEENYIPRLFPFRSP